MLSILRKLFKRDSHEDISGKVNLFTDFSEDDIPRYPPFAKGLPMASVELILATQTELIERIRNTLGYTKDDFSHLVVPVLHRYAAFVHLLPASEAHHHRGAGGLFRHGLEVAFWAAQASEKVIFSIEGNPQQRRDNEPRWRLASCLSGLLHDAGKPLSDVSITDKEGDKTWNPYSEMLVDWAARHQIDRYFIRWRSKRHKRHELFSSLTIERILTQDILVYLSASGPEIVEAMLEAVAGTSANEPIAKLMLKADQESVSRDMRQSRLNVDEFAYGVPVERYVFDAIRRLIKSGQWKVNEPGAKIWHLHQGVFIAWKQGIHDLYELITQDKIPGIPRDPDTLADILIERGFALPNYVQNKHEGAYYRYWEVLPRRLQEGDISAFVKLLMLRLESSELIFTTEPPAPVAGEVVGEAEEAEIKFTDLDTGNRPVEDKEGYVNRANALNTVVNTNWDNNTDQFNGSSQPQTKKANANSTITKGKSPSKPKAKSTVQAGKSDLERTVIASSPTPLAFDNPIQALAESNRMLNESDAFNTFPEAWIAMNNGGKTPNPTSTEQSKHTTREAPNTIPKTLCPDNALEPDLYMLTLRKKVTQRNFETPPNCEEPRKNEKQNVTRLRKQVESAEGKPNIDKSVIELGPVSIGLDDQDKEFATSDEKIDASILDKDGFLQTKITKERAIQILKEMIQKRSLAAPVIEQDGFLIVSDKALDEIVNQYPDTLSKHALKGQIGLDQSKPLLRIRQGQILLKMENP